MDTDHEIYVNRVMTENITDAMSWEMVREATRKDPEMKLLQEDIQAGQCRNALTGYAKVFEELTEVEGLVMRGEKLVLPKDLQAAAIQLAHEGHLGQEKPLGLLRETTWFPGMSQKVKEFS